MTGINVVNVRGWPGIKRWKPPRLINESPGRMGDRVALIIHFADIVGFRPGASPLGAYLLISGPSVVEAGFVVPGEMDTDLVVQFHERARAHSVDTLQGPQAWCVRTDTEFFHPRTGRFMRTTYTTSGWCIGVDLGRVLALAAEHVTVRNEPHADTWELWLPGWGKVHDRGRIKRVSPHRPCIRIRARRVGWQVEYGPVNLKAGYGMAEGSTYRHGEFLDLLTAAYVLDADRGASYAEHRENFNLPPMHLPLYVTPDEAGLASLAHAVRGMYAFALVIEGAGSQWFPAQGGPHA